MLAVPSCGGGVEALPKGTAGAAGAAKLVTMATPSWLAPETDHDPLQPWFTAPGHAGYMLAGMRIVVRDDGGVERATERFSGGDVKAVQLPERLGGGFAFFQSDAQGTRLWRADTWTGELTPLSHVGPSAAELIAGFDRLYLRTPSNELVALDAETGAIMPIGPLPIAAGYGAMAFADGWRAVVETDVSGPMASFDAGASWLALDVPQRVNAAAAVDGDPVLYVDDGYYRIDVRGQLHFVRRRDSSRALDGMPETSARTAAHHPLGQRPLRVAIEHGYPASSDSAVVLYRGALVRVSLPDGAVLAAKSRAIEDDTASCHGARVGHGFGFVCGVEAGPTTIYEYRPPLSLREVARFDEPRFVSASDNGALVVRGKCSANTNEQELRTYCIVGHDGAQREIAVRGEIGAERVVALTDGRVVVLVPPRFGRPGRITVIDGDKLSSNELTYPKEPTRAVELARAGLWLEGFEQRGKDRVGGWVEAGGPVVGVMVELDGTVELGKVHDEGGQVLMSGKFAVARTDAETGFESTDGGQTWREFELPGLPESLGDAKTRGCSPVGCALRGWSRVGWGESEVADDLRSVVAPKPAGVRPVVRDSIQLSCKLVSAPKKKERPRPVLGHLPFSRWAAFRGLEPPALSKGQIGVDKASDLHDKVPAHIYTWGSKGADWTRAGWWMVRFDDRFDPHGGIRSSALTRPPWADENSASEVVGARHRGSYWRLQAAMDPSGQAAIANLCKGSRCVPYAVSEARPILPLRVAPGALAAYRKPVEQGVVRVGESWYFLTEVPGASSMTLWRADLGVMRPAVTLRRLDQRSYPTRTKPRLVRRAVGGAVGLLIVQPPDRASGSQVGDWHVLPIDPATGQLGEPVSLGPADLRGQMPPRCQPHDDGWLLDSHLDATPAIVLRGARGYVDDIELRLRLDPGFQCTDGIAARSGHGLRQDGATKPAAEDAESVPLSVRERSTGRRWHLSCQPR